MPPTAILMSDFGSRMGADLSVRSCCGARSVILKGTKLSGDRPRRTRMRLRNPGTIDAGINAVEDLRRYLSNARSGNSLGPADPFLSWCEDYARPQLENLFAPTEDLFDDLDASYNLINNAPKSEPRRINAMLRREWVSWDR